MELSHRDKRAASAHCGCGVWDPREDSGRSEQSASNV